jgi:ribosomal protein S15P/S13E
VVELFFIFYPFFVIQNIFKAPKIECMMAKSKTEETKEKPLWMKSSDEDIKAIIVKLSKQGLTPEKIGLQLRDTYGIPTTRLTGKKLGQILKENNLYADSTLSNLEKKEKQIAAHLGKNKQDQRAHRSLMIIRARISKYQKYKKRKNAEPTEAGSERISRSGQK